MSFTVENLEEKNMVKLVIESTAEEFEAGLNTAYNKNKSKISLPGFRKGKAPRKMIEKMYGAEVFYEDAANSIIPDAYAKAADECGLELVSQPKINVTQLEAGKPFIFEAVVAIKPEVELGQYKGVEVSKNDVEATYLFFKTTLGQTDHVLYHNKNKLKLRSDIQNRFKLPCLNYPDVKIGEELIINLYCKKTGKNKFDLKKQGGTKRSSIALKDCIPHWANFETPEFQKLKKQFENTIITNLKGEFSTSVVFHGIKIDYGTGGAHSSAKPGVYVADDNWAILDEDIGSLYPSIAIQLGLYPEHLGPEFLEIYDKDIVSVRLAEKKKPKKERNMVIMEGFKLCANGIYGKSGEETSILYDPLYTMKTTIGGQMFLSLWTEKLVKAIPEIKFIQHNTDGITYLLPRKDISKAQAVAEEMSKLTGLYIEDNFYSKFILRDVNNYLAIYENGDYKAKGDFEIDKEYHKDPSMRIVPLAVKEYFINGIKIEDTIKNHTNIFDFCLRLKTNSKSDGIFTHLVDSKIINDELNRTTRYYISNSKNSGTLSKRFNDGRITRINVGYSAIIFNKYVEKEIKDYNIDYNFYIKEAYKLKNAVSNGQLSLF